MTLIREQYSPDKAEGLAGCLLAWPRQHIDNVVTSCKQCQDRLLLHPEEPFIANAKPAQPFQDGRRFLMVHTPGTVSWFWWIVTRIGQLG